MRVKESDISRKFEIKNTKIRQECGQIVQFQKAKRAEPFFLTFEPQFVDSNFRNEQNLGNKRNRGAA